MFRAPGHRGGLRETGVGREFTSSGTGGPGWGTRVTILGNTWCWRASHGPSRSSPIDHSDLPVSASVNKYVVVHGVIYHNGVARLSTFRFGGYCASTGGQSPAGNSRGTLLPTPARSVDPV